VLATLLLGVQAALMVCLLSAVYCLPSVAYCMLSAVCCLLSAYLALICPALLALPFLGCHQTLQHSDRHSAELGAVSDLSTPSPCDSRGRDC
jgi:hypothetical protein